MRLSVALEDSGPAVCRQAASCCEVSRITRCTRTSFHFNGFRVDFSNVSVLKDTNRNDVCQQQSIEVELVPQNNPANCGKAATAYLNDILGYVATL